MSATDERASELLDTADARLEAAPRGVLATVVGLLRGLLGALTLVGGLTWLLLNLHGPKPAVDLLVGVVMSVAGLVLLMPHRVQLPRYVAPAGAAVAALIGTGAGLLAESSQVCCQVAYVSTRGFPFAMMQRGAFAGTVAAARDLAASASWQVEVASLAVDLLFWAYTGLLIVVVVVLGRRALRARRASLVEGRP